MTFFIPLAYKGKQEIIRPIGFRRMKEDESLRI